ncbi:MAG: fatty acid desaturase [Verrucomicrobia bacterium]|nr:fatty acid desaturase [Verrucomicrobiota bacterium]
MNSHASASCPENPETENWRQLVKKYQVPSLHKSLWQISNTLIPYAGLWGLMYFTVQWSWPLTLAFATLAALFLVRVFIIFHDCGHGAYFKSKRLNNVVGFVTGLLTLTPYRHWKWQHAVHHGTSGNLDARGIGDVWTMTVKEYQSASWLTRLHYRVARNPVVLFGLVPLGLFLIYQRIPYAQASRRDRNSVHWMNLAILLYAGGLSWFFGFWNFLWIQLTITGISGTLGVWLFYVQHQFEDTYWRAGDAWDYTASAMEGSSFYKLPGMLNWFSGSIGYHHIHHLSSRIPNYNLKACHEAEPFFQQVPEINLRRSLRSLRLRLWDEASGKLVGFAERNHST